jgi:hypothetical protein
VRLRFAWPLGDVTHFLETCPRRLASLCQLGAQLHGQRPLDAPELEDDGGQALPDLVVELPSHAAPLALLGAQRVAGALPALGLQPLEHLVERQRQFDDLGFGAVDGDAPARLEQVDGAHQLGEAHQRRERPPEENEVHQQDHRQPGQQQHRLGDDDRAADRRRRQDQHQHRDQEHHAVHEEHPRPQ